MIQTAVSALGNISRYFEIHAAYGSLTYRIRHNAIQARTNRMGFFVLFTNTMMGRTKS